MATTRMDMEIMVMNMGIARTEIMPMSSDVPVLPDWTRWSWASRTERAWWAPLFQEATSAYMEVEKLSVVDGVRKAAYAQVTAARLVDAVDWARRHGVLCVPVSQCAAESAYSNVARTAVEGEPFSYRVLYVRPDDYYGAMAGNDQDLGALLGYPTCCRAAFDKTWGRGQVDSTWEQYEGLAVPPAPRSSHTLLRWMGMRLVSHMPCRANCEASGEIAAAMEGVGRRHGYTEEMMVLAEVLRWPVEWSRLFGIAEIVTPAVKLSVRSDWTPTKQMFSTPGHYTAPKETWWTDNGFADPVSMRTAHKDIINALTANLPQKATVLDLGCGNGMLLRRLKMHRPDVRIVGIDRDPQVIARAAEGLLSLTKTFYLGSIEDGAWVKVNPDAVLYNPGRIQELASTPELQARVRGWITQVPWQFPYIYADWQQRTTLADLCASVNIARPTPLIKSPSVEMGLVGALT